MPGCGCGVLLYSIKLSPEIQGAFEKVSIYLYIAVRIWKFTQSSGIFQDLLFDMKKGTSWEQLQELNQINVTASVNYESGLQLTPWGSILEQGKKQIFGMSSAGMTGMTGFGTPHNFKLLRLELSF